MNDHANLLKRYNTREVKENTLTIAVAFVEENIASLSSAPKIPVPKFQPEEHVNDIDFSPMLNSAPKEKALQIMSEFQSVLTDIPLNTPLSTYEMNVETAKPVFVKQYPLPHAKVEVVKNEVRDMLKLGVIEPAAIQFNSQIVLFNKPDGCIRLCTDYRKLNDVTVFDGENLPDVEQLFSKFGGAKFFTMKRCENL